MLRGSSRSERHLGIALLKLGDPGHNGVRCPLSRCCGGGLAECFRGQPLSVGQEDIMKCLLSLLASHDGFAHIVVRP